MTQERRATDVTPTETRNEAAERLRATFGSGKTTDNGTNWFYSEEMLDRALATERRNVVEQAAREADLHAERLKHTTHHDGLGMGWLAGEEVCRDIAERIRALDSIPTGTEEEEKP